MRYSWGLVWAFALVGCSSPHRSFLMNPQVPDSYVKALAKEERVSEDEIRQRMSRAREQSMAEAQSSTGRSVGARPMKKASH